MYKTLEHHEHAEHIAHGHAAGETGGHGPGEGGGRHAYQARLAALLVAVLAAGLAISEQGAKHAELRSQFSMINATDAWAQYQAKSTRGTLSADVMRMIEVMEPASTPELQERRKQTLARLAADQERFERDPKDGKAAIMQRAHAFEHERDHALEQTHAYHNGSAAMELGIVLATASAIIGSRLLILMALGIGVFGAACAVAGYLRPEWGAF